MKELLPELMQIVAAKFVTKPLYVAAQLGLPDLLQSGPLSADELAARTDTHAPSLYRLLRALASVGIFEESEGRRFRNTPRSEMFQNRVGSLRAMLLWINDPRHDRAWDNLSHCVKTGETAVPVTFGGREVWQWLRETPDLFAIFNEAMTSNAHNLHAAAAAACDFSGYRRLVDVGGGHGGLLASILDPDAGAARGGLRSGRRRRGPPGPPWRRVGLRIALGSGRAATSSPPSPRATPTSCPS